MGFGVPGELTRAVPAVSAALIEYGGFLKARNMSQSTQDQSVSVLKYLREAAGDIPVSDIQPHHIDTLFSNREWTQGTRNNYLQHINNFMKWCRVQRYMPYDYNPAAHWQARRVIRRNKTWLTLPVLEALVMGAGPRDRAFMAVGIFTFLRSSEIITLKIRDIDFQNDEIDVYRIKTKQEDRMPMCAELRAEMVLWLTHYREQCGTLDHEWLLVPAQGPQPMTGVPGARRLTKKEGTFPPLKPTTVISAPFLIVRRHMRRLGLEVKKGDGCHILRRSGARNLFEELRSQGHDGAARRTQSMLGHSSVVITEGYLGIDYERRKRNQSLAGKPMFGAGSSALEIESTKAITSD